MKKWSKYIFILLFVTTSCGGDDPILQPSKEEDDSSENISTGENISLGENNSSGENNTQEADILEGEWYTENGGHTFYEYTKFSFDGYGSGHYYASWYRKDYDSSFANFIEDEERDLDFTYEHIKGSTMILIHIDQDSIIADSKWNAIVTYKYSNYRLNLKYVSGDKDWINIMWGENGPLTKQ